MATKKLKHWFDKALAERLAQAILPHAPDFDAEGFTAAIAAEIDALELKARVALIADQLRAHLPPDYRAALSILMKILGPENPNETGMFSEYYWIMPIAAFVERYGLEAYAPSLAAICEITKRNTGEYCIRPFLDRYPEKTLEKMTAWSKDANVHLRRLASEGLRPRLPWSKKLDRFVRDPRPVIQVIEHLKDDPSRFVQKSVANNVNDILKDNRSLALDLLRRWSRGATPQRRWIIRHALRNLRQQGDPSAKGILDGLGPS
ncbi:MAG: DNA alkylation repair protein [Desulfosarcinaceae bacterium]|nr:DNA alkylation repair protein [Desulfosarcinaceae bacterium]